ncbi:response regulator [Deinococcus metallilatus]|uniref:Transcriptional regulatory protein n=1 Tax=Deinococcus metallilatus TaxID=1211322 RepID=A0AAJ5JXK9_9DEIO|nr:response regulator [Deinococcus metallilatus]MBB5297028.1 response regulator of citrate/malate metabolism [Deinococcus metallilatus]QBY07843.1 response regulator [Deinococcus metallilatus]RXJ13192.1 response regulator [Deinococcus metallilatus]TLK23035.1 response regulator [Deinococcus metallilatus]GMA15994.1 transcriptional regulatory protein [Deinococcus metallilatus]
MTPIRTLIVEDDPRIAALHRGLLEGAGDFEVLGTAETLRVARVMAGTLHPDLLLLDVYLPDGRGLDLLREWRARSERVDAILLTAASDIPSVQDALALGAADYLVKPCTPERFALALDRVRERAALWGQDAVRQGHLDALFARPPVPASGLDAETLHRVRAALRGGGAYSASELGQALGLSRVTAWRYLEHLVEAGEASAETDARGIGRPVKRYRRA